MAAITAPVSGGRSDAGRKYGPLSSLAIALFIALVVLPSALNLPQTNPTTTLEYAPVPPSNDKDTPPDPGNTNSLGLGTSPGVGDAQGDGGVGDGSGGTGTMESTTTTMPKAPSTTILPDGTVQVLPPDDAPAGQGKTASTKRCIGSPPRQTEDPLAPPCVADFQGDNFGSTFQGVTGTEVKILFYIQGFTNYTNTCSDPAQVTPDKEYFDLLMPAKADEHCVVRELRTYQAYFNDRYQAYKRYVHFYVYFSGKGASAEERTADAADNYNRIKPFAVISTGATFSDDYLKYMANRSVLNFGTFVGRKAEFFQNFPKLIWGYPPSLDQQAAMFVGYICKKVAGQKSVDANSPNLNGKDRVYGLWSTSDKGHQELIALAAQVKDELASKCGVKFAVEATFPEAGYAKSAAYTPDKARAAAAAFRDAGVTTIIWPAGLETNLTTELNTAGYLPEIVSLGDGDIETNTSGGFQNATAYNHTRMVTTQLLTAAAQREEPCYIAYKEGDPDGDNTEASGACEFYPLIRQLFTGIQVAGPRLSPTSVDKGFHAIPRKPSTDPKTPACFYEVGDYTCVKDAEVEKWDSTAGGQGCFRTTQGGQRYFADIWPMGNTNAQDADGSNACNNYDGSYLVNPAAPDPTNPGG